MTWNGKSFLPRRRGKFWIKFGSFTIFCWWLIVFGFSQKSDSKFGEHLDRNHIELQRLTLTTVQPSTGSTQDFGIFKELFGKLSSKGLKLINIPGAGYDAGRTTIGSAGEAKVAASKEKEIKEETTEKLGSEWKFSPPPNIFGTDNVGELGKAVTMPVNISPEIKKIYDEGWKNNYFNQYLSDLISVNRSLPDFRTDYCKNEVTSYSQNLPATSVIIIFHNEAWSTLLRSVHSVLNRSPEHLITEVILVDDFSDMEHLKQPLEAYMSNFPKVKILRAPERQGLIKARLRGTAVAKGPVLTFLDSHIECMEGWLEPLLDRIAINPTNVVCPVIEITNAITFEIVPLNSLQIGGFDWTLNFKWTSVSESEKKKRLDPSEPVRSPTMAGGLFAIDKAFFLKLGMYDPEFDIWGAENLELSFKTWMCGGTLEIIPCSHVSHIFREDSPIKGPPGHDYVFINSVRLAKVWMDDYAKFYFARSDKNYEGKYGDISDRVKLRENLKCNSFEWYLENVYPDLELPDDGIAYGEIRNLGYGGDQCLDASEIVDENVVVYNCHNAGGHQYWDYKDGFIKRDDVSLALVGNDIKIASRRENADQKWTFWKATNQFHHRASNKCLAMTNDFKVLMEDCNESAEGQQWKLEHLVTIRLKTF